jgi:hypothetical protein
MLAFAKASISSLQATHHKTFVRLYQQVAPESENSAPTKGDRKAGWEK